MVFSLIGAREDELAFRKIEDLRAELGFVNMREMTQFLHSNRFQPYFDIYADAWIKPQQKIAQELGTSRGRGPQFVTVEERMLVGERSGSDKFSSTFPNKSEWDQIDHCAYAMYHIARANSKSASGLFYNKGLSQAQINLRVWMLIKYEEYNHAPSKQKGALPKPSSEKNQSEVSTPLLQPSANNQYTDSLSQSLTHSAAKAFLGEESIRSKYSAATAFRKQSIYSLSQSLTHSRLAYHHHHLLRLLPQALMPLLHHRLNLLKKKKKIASPGEKIASPGL